MTWAFLAAAIAIEVAATLCLRLAALGRRRLYLVVVLGYTAAFVCLSGALAQGMAIGVAYGIWTAVGICLTAVLSRLLFEEPMTRLMLVGIGLIIGGVLLIEAGSAH
ncbi:QacE family quaternary ammonium compound efflux SMR transporter [Rhodococcus fascians]|nr:QacE family quaternary ammonium compound efflux SMR transporter [Rhodococcus fascians]MBY4417255.1 QacE family quaternary ammonium compound efflux SMR transporter [Rhodococcus fascians]